MLFSVGLDTMMASVETTVTAIVDTFPKLYKSTVSVSIFVCIAYFLLGLMYCGHNGFYWIRLFDTFCGSETNLLVLKRIDTYSNFIERLGSFNDCSF